MLSEDLLKKVKRIEIISKKISREVFAGTYHSNFKGRGMEFASVREYCPGDDVRSIDWNVSSRTGRLHVKQYVEERELTMILALDLSASMFFFSQENTKRELMAEISAIMAFAANINNDKVGLLLFSDQIERYVPPRKGRQHILRIIRDILEYTPTGRKTSIESGLVYLSKVLKKRAIVVLCSDFLDEGYERALAVTGKKHDLILMRYTDPRERSLPKAGLFRLQDSETGRTVYLDLHNRNSRDLFARTRQRRDSRLGELVRRYRIDELEFTVGSDYERKLIGFFAERRKRLRR